MTSASSSFWLKNFLINLIALSVLKDFVNACEMLFALCNFESKITELSKTVMRF